MKNVSTSISPLIYARVAGILYLSSVPLGIFGLVYVPSVIIVPGDAATTASNIIASETLFRLSIVTNLTCFIVLLFLVLTLYKLLYTVNKTHALLMVIFILVSIPIGMLNELNRLAVLQLLSGADYLTAFKPDQLHALVTLFFSLHKHGYLVGQIFFGLWLLPLGFLVFKSGYLPRILGVLLIIGCFGHLVDLLTVFLFPSYEAIISQIAISAAAVGEIAFCLWLVIKGVNVEEWEKRALEYK